MRILVTGSEGFVGPHLVRELRSAGHAVTEMDYKISGRNDASSQRHLREKLEQSQADVIVHLATVAADRDVSRMLRENISMIGNVSSVAAEHGVRVVVGSSAHVYGEHDGKCSEVQGPWKLPSDLYVLSKLWEEQLGELINPQGFTSLRFSRLYGPGLPSGRSPVVDALRQASRGGPVQIIENMKGSWCWVGDAMRAVRIAIELGKGPFNIGNDDDWKTVHQVAEIACKLTGCDPSSINEEEGIVRAHRISDNKIRSLGWTPSVGLEEGMKMTLDSWEQT